METFKLIVDVISVIANLFTVVASGIAIYVFIAKRKELTAVFSIFLNWTFQLTIGELKSKLERLNEYNASEPSEISEIQNILHEIAGQIRGNPRLMTAAPAIAEKVEKLATGKRLSEPHKRAIVSELREVLRNIEVNSLTTSGAENV